MFTHRHFGRMLASEIHRLAFSRSHATVCSTSLYHYHHHHSCDHHGHHGRCENAVLRCFSSVANVAALHVDAAPMMMMGPQTKAVQDAIASPLSQLLQTKYQFSLASVEQLVKDHPKLFAEEAISFVSKRLDEFMVFFDGFPRIFILLRILLERHPDVFLSDAHSLSVFSGILHMRKEYNVNVDRMLKYATINAKMSVEQIEARASFLRSALDLSHEKVCKIFERMPQIVGYNVQNAMQNRVDFLKSIHVDAVKACARVPQLLILSLERRMVPRAEYVRQRFGFTDDALLGKVLTRAPSLLYVSPESVEERIQFLEKKGFSMEQIKKMVSVVPQVLNLSVEGQLAPKMGYIHERFGFSVDAIASFPTSLLYSLERRIHPRLQALRGRVEVPYYLLTAILPPSDALFCERFKIDPQDFVSLEKDLADLGHQHPDLRGLVSENRSTKWKTATRFS
ncbi:mitochondrial transcription termination factor (mTERF) [Andalucia godoyi]|uniref:Mitochondrial transcription termination factor (mTERF) n=1 Tax=Andalucia godoyi TaxID=505711 RepID=A0A8K0AI19_ANDGO|nr:mitochondrial transcription termination factor (mTERF) [Andalucia godoyi]|eukprot:ANDGO_04308.mRNA.1 mitochondrial transcription termination factor (mTERF)